jgi:nicotinamide riboside transporter PnuC
MCFSLAWAEQLCIWIIVVVAVWSIIKLLLPYVTQFLPAIVVQIIQIVLWAIIAIICIYIIFGLLGCLLGSGPLHFPR